jgi:hypothetical protein
VRYVSRCRANSFYVAPGQYRTFEDWAVFTRVDGEWREVTHRRDVEKLSSLEAWDGVCYMMWRPRALRDGETRIDIAARIKNDPQMVEVWRLDDRIVNGKRSKGLEHHLHAVARRGAVRSGGVKEAVGVVLGATPAGKIVARWFESELKEPTMQAMALKLFASARTVLDDQHLESLASRMQKLHASIPMPVFDTAVTQDLAFLERYPMSRRVTLLEDLWETQVAWNLATLHRVADQLMYRGDNARERALVVLDAIDRTAPDLLLRLVREERLFLGGIPEGVGENLRSRLLANPKLAHLAAFHPATTDPSHALAVLNDRSHMESVGVTLYDGPLHPNVVRAVGEHLKSSRDLTHTHSSTKSRNLTKLCVVLSEADPSYAPLVAKAFASWTRTNGSLDSWFVSDADRVFEDRHLVLDRTTVEQLYKRSVEHALTVQKHSISEADIPSQMLVSSHLLAVLEVQSAAPEGIRRAAREILHDAGHRYRSERGVLVADHDYVRQAADKVAAALTLMENHVEEVASRSAYSRPYKHALQPAVTAITSGLTDEEFAILFEGVERIVNRLSRGVDPRGAEAVEEIRAVQLAMHGELDPAALGDKPWLHPAYLALTDHAQVLPSAVRQALINGNHDYDPAFIGYILHDETDVVSALSRDTLSENIQLCTLLNENPLVPWPEKPKRWSDLPTADHLPWELAPVSARFSNTAVTLGSEVFAVRVIPDMPSLVANAAPNCMGNCTDTYADDIRRGSTIILAIGRDGRTEINVSLEKNRSDDSWEITETKRAHNKPLNSDEERALHAQLTTLLREQA